MLENSAPGLLVVLAIWFSLRAVNFTLAVILRAKGRIRVQCAAQVVEAILHISLMAILSQRLGLYGVALGGLLATFCTQSWILPWDLFLSSTNAQLTEDGQANYE